MAEPRAAILDRDLDPMDRSPLSSRSETRAAARVHLLLSASNYARAVVFALRAICRTAVRPRETLCVALAFIRCRWLLPETRFPRCALPAIQFPICSALRAVVYCFQLSDVSLTSPLSVLLHVVAFRSPLSASRSACPLPTPRVSRRFVPSAPACYLLPTTRGRFLLPAVRCLTPLPACCFTTCCRVPLPAVCFAFRLLLSIFCSFAAHSPLIASLPALRAIFAPLSPPREASRPARCCPSAAVCSAVRFARFLLASAAFRPPRQLAICFPLRAFAFWFPLSDVSPPSPLAAARDRCLRRVLPAAVHFLPFRFPLPASCVAFRSPRHFFEPLSAPLDASRPAYSYDRRFLRCALPAGRVAFHSPRQFAICFPLRAFRFPLSACHFARSLIFAALSALCASFRTVFRCH